MKEAAHSKASNFLDEDFHFVSGDGAIAVLVELLEAGVEVTFAEVSALTHFGKSVLHECLGLVLVEESGVVFIVVFPDVVDAVFDDLVNIAGGHVVYLIITITTSNNQNNFDKSSFFAFFFTNSSFFTSTSFAITTFSFFGITYV